MMHGNSNIKTFSVIYKVDVEGIQSFFKEWTVSYRKSGAEVT